MKAGLAVEGAALVISNYPVEAEQELRRVALRLYEARVYQLY